MNLYYLKLFFACLFSGQFKRLWNEAYIRVYKFVISFKYYYIVRSRRILLPTSVHISTEFPVAENSFDNLYPKGAKMGFTNKGFLLKIEKEMGVSRMYLDLGCAQGELVKDAIRLGWNAFGVDGASIAEKGHIKYPYNFFLADITKPFYLFKRNYKLARFDLITAWEVLEHIPENKLIEVFLNIVLHLKEEGLFIASTSREPDFHEGFDLHVTKMTNNEWKRWIEKNVPQLVETTVDLEIHEFARQNFKDPSFLIYKKR